MSSQPDVVDVELEPSCPWRRGSGCPRSRSWMLRVVARCMCCIRNGGSAPNDTVASSCTTHSMALATTESARLRAYSSRAEQAGERPAPRTMTTTRTMDSGSRKSFLSFTGSEEPSCGGRSAPARNRSAGCGCGGPGGCGGRARGIGHRAIGRTRPSGSVTRAILPYRAERTLSGCASPRSSRGPCARRRGRHRQTSSCGSAPADASTSPSGGRHQAAADTGRARAAAISSPG